LVSLSRERGETIGRKVGVIIPYLPPTVWWGLLALLAHVPFHRSFVLLAYPNLRGGSAAAYSCNSYLLMYHGPEGRRTVTNATQRSHREAGFHTGFSSEFVIFFYVGIHTILHNCENTPDPIVECVEPYQSTGFRNP